MVIAWIPFIVMIVGLLLWALASRPLVAKAGEWWFVIGSLATFWHLAGVTLKLP